MDPIRLRLLLAHADDGTPVVDDLPPSGAPDGAERAQEKRRFLGDLSADPNALDAQRWGVVAPEGDAGDRLLALIEPLILHRAALQGAPVAITRFPAAPTDVFAWKKQHFEPRTEMSLDVPRYRLILGDLDAVPLAVQQALASDGFTGRLAFDREEQWGAYVEKLLRWERDPATNARGDVLFHGVADGTAATRAGLAGLVAPALDVARRRRTTGQFPAAAVLDTAEGRPPTPDALLAAARTDRPSVLFTLSHGMGAPRAGWADDEAQRRLQGALTFGPHGRLTGEDVADVPFVPGGLWFLFACFGAGTPDRSAYRPWLEILRRAGQLGGDVDALFATLPRDGTRPFVAALPKAALANPRGPLAVVAHVDLAWTTAFEEQDGAATANRSGRFLEVLRGLVKGTRAGSALRALDRVVTDVNAELAALDQAALDARSRGLPATPDAARRGHLGLLRADVAGYVLLGDPAARLPLAGTAARPAPVTERPPIEELERVILRVLTGDAEASALATRMGMEEAELRRLAGVFLEAGRAALRRG